jgi:predicted DNA-binding transcriptional regulator AlpA
MFVMTHPTYLREKARSMRIERQLTIDELAERLALSRSTIYYWVRDLPIPGSGSGGVFPEATRRKGNRAMQRKYRLLREAAYREGLREYDGLVAAPTFRDFVCLYIAEGYKRNRNSVSICNSDPAVMQIASRWIRCLSRKAPEALIQYHADQDLNELREFWGATIGIEPGAIKLQRKSNSNQLAGRVWRSRHGVVQVRVHDTLLRARLQAWMDRLRSEWR